MRTLLHAILIMSSLLSPAWADVTVKQKIVNGTGASAFTVNVTLYLKGQKLRFDTMQQMSVIMDMATGDRLYLMHPQKLCLVTSLAREAEMMAMVGKQAGIPLDRPVPQLRPTGRKETINGFEAEEFLWKGTMAGGSFWVAKDIPDAGQLNMAMDEIGRAARMVADIPELKGVDGLVVRARMDMKTPPPMGASAAALASFGTTTASISEIESISREELPATLFQGPSDYRVMKQ